MKAMRNLVRWALISASIAQLQADPCDGEIVRGPNYEGVIFTPEMLSGQGLPYGEHEEWRPSVELIRRAEAALPLAIAEKTKYGMPIRGPAFPRYFTPKSSMRPENNGDPHLVDTDTDSVEESNFLFLVRSYYGEQKRQYAGVVIKGKRLLLISFLYGPGIFNDPAFDQWKHHWIEVLDGGDNFWRVLYDPVTNKFSGWQCNGYA